jgi:hypothetical protein
VCPTGSRLMLMLVCHRRRIPPGNLALSAVNPEAAVTVTICVGETRKSGAGRPWQRTQLPLRALGNGAGPHARDAMSTKSFLVSVGTG